MGDEAVSINTKKRISLSRNRPIALVVGAAGFLGSHVVDELLRKDIQVIGLDDLSSGSMRNLEFASKQRDFHFIHQSIALTDYESLLDDLVASLPRLDYAFFAAHSNNYSQLYGMGVDNFLRLISLFRTSRKDDEPNQSHPRVCFVSSIELYGNDLSSGLQALKSAEIKFAKYVKSESVNGRIVRLAGMYGPRMHFGDHDPINRLLHAKALNKLESESTALSFSSRAMFVDDAVALVLKSVFNGGTAQKIYDGVLLHPIKTTDLKRVILDPQWYKSHEFQPEILPPWPTPNLVKTMEELKWQTKTDLFKGINETLKYFEKEPVIETVARTEPVKEEAKPFFASEMSEEMKRLMAEEKRSFNKQFKFEEPEEEELVKEEKPRSKRVSKLKGRLLALSLWGLIIYALIFPLVKTVVGAVMLKSNLKGAVAAMEEGDFNKALAQTRSSEESLGEIKQLVGWVEVVSRVGLMRDQVQSASQLVSVAQDGVQGAESAVKGVGALYQIGKIISGEDGSDPTPVYQQASVELQTAREKLAKVTVQLKDPELTKGMPGSVTERVADLSTRLDLYLSMVVKAQAAAAILPQVTAVDGKKSYLVLLQNNMELRPTGGFIGSYAKLDFENGRIKNIKVDDVYNLDGNLKEVITPPAELVTDLGQKFWYLRDSNWEPDFPTAARQAEFFYNREAGERVNGVMAMDLSTSAKLLSAVGGLSLNEYGETVTGSNLFERAISHSEANFFPGSQAKKNYLTALENQLFNKIFFLSKQNWPAIIQALNESLEQKHLMVYLADPTLFSYVASAGWGGVMPRGGEEVAGMTNDFIAPVEANLGANKSNYYLERRYKLTTVFGKEGQVYHNLQISYKNSSPSDVFPAGIYKNRLRVYLPLGAKLNKATFGGQDIVSKVSAFNDYGRSGYSMLLEVKPKEEKVLQLDYELAKQLNFADNQVVYQLDVLKQPGTERDPFEWQLTYPINYKLVNKGSEATASEQELNISTNLSVDRSFKATFSR